MQYVGLVQINGTVEQHSVTALQGYLPYDATGAALIAQMQAALPAIAAAPLNQITVGDRGLVIFP
jgi:hypothetical protein